MKVSDIAKTFNLPISKLSIDYNKPREIGYIFTLIGKNREYFVEQGTLKDIIFTLVYLISTNFLSEDKKRTI